MNYYDKYIKYKTKYNKLKNYNMIGSAILSRNYYLHIRFSKELEDKFAKVKTSLSKYEYIKDAMGAHITISYGPKIEYDDMRDPSIYEIKDLTEIENIYPKFLQTFRDKIPDIKYIGVTPFLRKDNIVIKAEIKSDVLTEMIVFCRKNILSYNKTITEWKDDYEKTKEDIMKRYPNLFKEDHSFDETPIGALHITLITIKPDTPEKNIIDIILEAETLLNNVGIYKDCTLVADRIDVKTPITKKFIDIKKYII